MRQIAKAIILDSSDNILVLRRSQTHPAYALQLDFPGGEVEGTESPIEAVSREVFEETGLLLNEGDFQLAHQAQMSPTRVYIILSTQLHSHKPVVKLSWEHDKYEWLPAQELLARDVPVNADDFYLTVIAYLTDSAHV